MPSSLVVSVAFIKVSLSTALRTAFGGDWQLCALSSACSGMRYSQ